MSERHPSGPPSRRGPVPTIGAGPSRFAPLLIVGASVRAAAASAVRAGFDVNGIDLFGDADLVALGGSRLALRDQFPESSEPIARSLSPGPWMYTGPLENFPDTVDRLAECRPLWGIGGDSLRAVRDPFRVQGVLRKAGLPVPDVRSSALRLSRNGDWLIKPLRSSGGQGIRRLLANTPISSDPIIFQRRIQGLAASSLYVAGSRGCRWLGATEQRLGRPGEPYCYAGSLGPLPTSITTSRLLRRLGSVLRAEYALRGLFGVDVVIEGEIPWSVEVNPRYTASVEVLELAQGRNHLADHAAAFTESNRPPRFRPAGRYIGKAILFARETCIFDPRRLNSGRFGWPQAWSPTADIPAQEQTFQTGDPVMTVFARASTLEACRRKLGRSLERWRDVLAPA